MKKKKRQSPQKDYNVNFTRRLPAFWSFIPICLSLTCTLFRGSTKQLFALDTVPIINPPESLPTSNSEKLTQLKNHKPTERTEIDITSKIPVVVTVVNA